jgi:small ligand-binding sensory domain FIST
MIASGLSTRTKTVDAAREAAAQAVESLEHPPDVSFLFFSHHHAERVEEVVAPVLGAVRPGHLLGCSTDAPISSGQEIEEGPCVAVWSAYLGGKQNIHTFTMGVEDTADGPALVGFPLRPDDASTTIMLADPFTFPTQQFLKGINEDRGDIKIVGGMASGAPEPGGNLLVYDDSVRNFGAVGIVVGQGVHVTSVVSQGCKPIGDPLVVTSASDNQIIELAGAPPLNRLREIVAGLSPSDRGLVQNGLLIGLAIDEYATEGATGDFLVRGFQAHPASGVIAVGDRVEVGQTIQFQIRDASTADAELRALLGDQTEPPPKGALIFTCNGRGIGMFGEPHHDAATVESILGDIPATGMFCQGELGPVASSNFLHGFTASIALFR